MKTFLKIPVLLLLAIMAPLISAAQPAKTAAAKPMPKKSVFVMPSNPKEGRDPFFPESTRPYEAAVANSHVVELTTLAVKGYSVVNGTPCVIINNHSFMAGDEGDVMTPGGRVHLRCLAIKPTVAIVEVNGQRHDLNF